MHDLEGNVVVREESCTNGCGGSTTVYQPKLFLLLLVLEASYSRTYFSILLGGLNFGKDFKIKVELFSKFGEDKNRPF